MNNSRLRRTLPVSVLLPCVLSACSHTQAPPPAVATAPTSIKPATLPIVTANFETSFGKSTGDARFAPGLNGKALTLNGGGSVELTQGLDTSKSYTVMAWIKPTKVGGFQTFISGDGPQNSAFFLQLRDDSKRFALAALAENGTPSIASAKEDPDLDIWTHLAGVYNADQKTISLFVNGVLQASVPFAGAYRAPGPLRLGRAKFGGQAVDFASGQIDEVQVFQNALSGEQIQAIARPFIGKPGTMVPVVPATLALDVSKVRARVSPTLYGLMTEEINHSYDGGLYGELLQNRAFTDDGQSAPHWSLVLENGAKATMSLDSALPLSPAVPRSLKLEIPEPQKGRVCLANDGFWGVPLKPNTRYEGSFWARGYKGPLTMELQDAQGKRVANVTVNARGRGWKHYTATLSTGAIPATTNGRFLLGAQNPGTVWLSLVSLFPPTFKNRINGNRVDLSEKMAAMKPKFLRFPGGNYLEGNTINERFDWKKTLGPLENRAGHASPWNYRSTDGMGLLEFLEWCDDLQMEPVLAVYAGYSLKGEFVKPGADLQPFVQDALDEIEFVTGDPSTKWGRVRAKLGHRKPWKLEYVEIGNEDFFDKSGSYEGRFAQFFDAIKARYPKLQVISTTMDERTRIKTRRPDVVDEHYYLDAREMERRATFYDKYDRKGPKIFVGEWASHTERIPWQDPQGQNAPTSNMGAALGDAAFMTGMERNSDIVVMQCYAPLLVNVNPGARQWAPNLIGYDNLNSFGAPSYYAQAMFAQNLGDVVLDSVQSGGKRLSSSVTRDTRNGALFLKIVNPTDKAQPVQITAKGATVKSGEATILRGASLEDTNSLAQPTKIVPVTTPLSNVGASFSFSAPPYSICVLKLNAK